eukprot:scaffold483_cov107-Isochrysis_galbana.AAC.4
MRFGRAASRANVSPGNAFARRLVHRAEALSSLRRSETGMQPCARHFSRTLLPALSTGFLQAGKEWG